MTTTNPRPTILALTTVIAVILIGGVAGAVVATEDARLAIDQPHYIDDGVQSTTINGTQAYVVHGPVFDLHPQNFDPGNVTDFGVATSAGSLEYNANTRSYTFDAEGETGTFELYWIVETPRTIVVNNTTTTQTVAVRYQAYIRVAGQASMVHVTEQQNAQREHYIALGRAVNNSIEQIREDELLFAPDEGSDFELFQAMLTRYVTTGDPIQAFTGNYTDIWFIVLWSPGGWLFLAQFLAIIVWLLVRRYKHRSEQAEKQAIEGDLSDKMAALDEAERQRIAANLDWNDFEFPDSISRGFRDVLSDNPHRAYQFLKAGLLIGVVRDRLQAMHQTGYVGVLDAGTETNPEAVTIVDEDDVAEDAATISLENPSPELVDAVAWDDEELLAFDLVDAEYDPAAFDDDLSVADLEELAADLDVDMRYFADIEEFGQYLHEFLESVREHPYTDENGGEQPTRAMMELLLEKFNLMEREGLPAARLLADGVEAAIHDYDRQKRAQEYAEEVRDGAHN